ncbi:hypothetical protein V8G54_028603 [Vigna mungo]|uniref:Transposase MuDR plant domain-containing protein n=1 Tax=Vigna mungo TaxID=3915 RepID=A0AAQ3MS96_VIGMU
MVSHQVRFEHLSTNNKSSSTERLNPTLHHARPRIDLNKRESNTPKYGEKFVNDRTLKYEGRLLLCRLTQMCGEGSVLEDRLKLLIDDIGAMYMVNLARPNGQGHVYIVHVVFESQIIHMLEYINDYEREVETMLHESSECVGKVGSQCEGQCQGHSETQERSDCVGELEGDHVIQEEVHEGKEDGGVSKNPFHFDGGVEGDDDCEEVVEEEVDVRSRSSSNDHGSLDGNSRCLKGLVVVSVECDIDCHIDVEWFGNVEVELQSLLHEFSGPCSSLTNDEWQSEELVSRPDNDEEVNDNEGYEKHIKFVKSDKTRLRLKCVGAKGKCPWTIYCAYMKVLKIWQLRTIVDTHICSREFNLRLLDAKWLSKKLEKKVRENPKVKGVDIYEKIQIKWNIYRAKAIVSDQIDRSFKEQYMNIYDYAHELLARNP